MNEHECCIQQQHCSRSLLHSPFRNEQRADDNPMSTTNDTYNSYAVIHL